MTDRSETGVCVACHAEIDREAIKCPNCGTFQNWRRHLQFTTTILSLLIALVSVSGLVLPGIWNVLFQGARLHAELVEPPEIRVTGAGGGEAGNVRYGARRATVAGSLIISNSGNRPAYLRSVRVALRLTDGPAGLTIDDEARALPFTMTLPADDVTAGATLAPDHMKFVDFQADGDLQAYYPEQQNARLVFSGSQVVIEFLRDDLSTGELSLPLEDFTWRMAN